MLLMPFIFVKHFESLVLKGAICLVMLKPKLKRSISGLYIDILLQHGFNFKITAFGFLCLVWFGGSLIYEDGCSNAGVSHQDISSAATKESKSRNVSNYLKY